jgi:diaminopimelate decarboxylase
MNTSRASIDRLIQLLGGTKGAELLIGPFPISALTDSVGTPFYVYNGDVVLQTVRQVRQELGTQTDLYYSLKANPSLGLCQLIAMEGLGAEVASGGELLLAQKARFPQQKTIFAGPGKTNEELELALQLGIQSINVESPGEVERLAQIASRMGRCASICLRVNPSILVKGAGMRMGGGAQQFGIDEEQIPDVVSQVKRHPYIRIIGLHWYLGTQIFDVEGLVASCRHLADLGARTAKALEQPFELMDFGGGFGVPYHEESPQLDLSLFARGFCQVMLDMKREPLLRSTRLAIELGRYLVAEAGVYVTRVVDVKHSRGERIVVTDGGMNHHIAATGNFGQVFRKRYPMAILNRLDAPLSETATIVGPCCTPLDVFGQHIACPQVEVGDLVGVFCSGAYGYSASSLAFLSHPTPAEILVWDGKFEVLRPRGRFNQILDTQRSIRAAEHI